MTQDRYSAIGRVTILVNVAEQDSLDAVEVTTSDLRMVLRDRKDLAEKLADATRTIEGLGSNSDRWKDAFGRLAEAVEAACSFDAGETLPESAPWAAALNTLDDALNEIRDGLKAAA